MTINTLERITSLRFWMNRFAEYTEHAQVPKGELIPTEAECLAVADFYPDHDNWFCECGHVAVANGQLGLLIEWEYDDYVVPDPARVAHWRIVAPEGCIFDAYAGNETLPTYDDRWVMAAFVPQPLLTKELVTRVTDLMQHHV